MADRLMGAGMFGRAQFFIFKYVFVILGVAWVSGWLVPAGMGVATAGDAGAVIHNCNIQKGPCTQLLNGRMVTLDILPRPVKAMEDLTFKVSIDAKVMPTARPYIRLNMPAMDMGANLVKLKTIAPGVYAGRGVIVRCRSGIRTWKATVMIPGIGTADFVFDVIY